MSLDWDLITKEVAQGVNLLAPFAASLVPGAAPAIKIIEAIISGAAAAEPVAVALVKQIQAGSPPTPDQLKSYYAAYQADDNALKADIEAHLAALAANPVP